MKTYLKTAVGILVVVVSLVCADQSRAQEALWRGLAQAYSQRAGNNPNALGALVEGFLGGFFGTLADQAREERRAQQMRQYYGLLSQQQLYLDQQSREQQTKAAINQWSENVSKQQPILLEWIGSLEWWIRELDKRGIGSQSPLGAHYSSAVRLRVQATNVERVADLVLRIVPEYDLGKISVDEFSAVLFLYKLEVKEFNSETERFKADFNKVLALFKTERILKARAEIEEFLETDRESFGEWEVAVKSWIKTLEERGVNSYRESFAFSHYRFARKFVDQIEILDSRAKYYLGNLPNYISEEMDLNRVQTEIQDYLGKRKSLLAMRDNYNKELAKVNEMLAKTQKEIEKEKKIRKTKEKGF